MTLYSREAGIDVPPERQGIGYVFQHYAPFPRMTVYDNVAFGLRMRKAPAETIERRVREELESPGMGDLHRSSYRG